MPLKSFKVMHQRTLTSSRTR